MAVIAGSLVGLLVHNRLPPHLSGAAFEAIGIFTLYLGCAMALRGEKILLMILSIVLGAILGTLLNLDHHMNRFSQLLKNRLRIGTGRFSEGLTTAFLLFCMGSMTVLGAIEEGLGQTPNLYFAKSLLDGIAAIALTAGLGIGVMFAALPLFIYQSGLTLLARGLTNVLTPAITNELTAVGGLILLGVGINLLEIRRLKVINLLPALLIVVLLGMILRK